MAHVRKQMLSCFITTKCNLRCVYCYNSEERHRSSEQTIPLEFAKQGVDYFFDNFDSRHIRFYGPGEPTQELERMREITEYARGKSEGPLTVELQTNGAFSESTCDWIRDNVNLVWVSFDGTPDIQDRNRPFPQGKPSSGIIERNVRSLTQRPTDANNVVGVRVTMTNDNLCRQLEMVDYFENLGVKNIWTDPVFPEVKGVPFNESPERQKGFFFDYDKYVDEYVKAYRYAKDKGVFYGSFLMINFDDDVCQHCRACTPVPHLTTDGYISACDMVTFGSNPPPHMGDFVYGKWNETDGGLDFFGEKVSRLRGRVTENIESCKGCRVSHHCGGYCLGEVTNESGTMYGKKPKVCGAIMRLHDEIADECKVLPYLHP